MASKNHFGYQPTAGIVTAVWQGGQWARPEFQKDPHLKIHAGATALNYGQAVFEGLKAFCCKDGVIRLFRPHANFARMADAAMRMQMPPVPNWLFMEAIMLAVKENKAHVPAYGTSGSLYVRPVLIGAGPQLGLKSAEEFLFYVVVTPVEGSYYTSSSLSAMVVSDFDRAAPLGVGRHKVAGNYAPALLPNNQAAAKGAHLTLYTDAKEHKYVEEFNSSNFLAVLKDGKLVTPESASVLPGITLDSLLTLAGDLGWEVERRPIELARELDKFAEIGAVGTAVIIAPVSRLLVGEQEHKYPVPENGKLTQLREMLRAIQTGDEPDRFRWMLDVCKA